MRNFHSLVLGVACVILATHGLVAADKETPAKTSGVSADPLSLTNPPPESIFQSDNPTGKDPFFPKSTRRVKKATVTPGNTNVTEIAVPPPTLLFRGFLGDLVLINNQDFAKGEEKVVTTADKQKVRVRVVDIRQTEKVVVISVDGSKELQQLKLKGRSP